MMHLLAEGAASGAQTGVWTIVAALVTLTALEIVLGIDNVVMLAVIGQKLPQHQRPKAMRTGLALAMLMRIGLLLVISWVTRLDEHALFSLGGHDFSVKDLILVVGGVLLLTKAVLEIHRHVEEGGRAHVDESRTGAGASFWGVIAQVLLMDAVFSIDSVLTAVGMTSVLWVMITAVVLSVVVMMFFATGLSRFIEQHPTVKVLALAFLVMIGVLLVADGTGVHVPRGYVYSAMVFAVFVEFINMRTRASRKAKREARRAGTHEADA